MTDASSSSDSPSPYDDLAVINAQLLEQNVKLEQENELVKFKLEQLERYVYGKRSEKHYPEVPEQGRLFGEETPEDREEEYIEVAAHKNRRRSKKSIPEDLPVDEVVYEPAESHCTECGEELVEFSRDVREEVEFEPARFFKRHHVTVHCSCRKCSAVYSGEAPPERKPVIPGSQVGAGFLAQIMVSKYCDYLPYYRQSQIYEREGVFFPDKTLSRYGLAVGALLEPVAKAVKWELLARGYLQADETHIDVLDTEKSSGTHRGQLWVLGDPLSSLTYYEYHPGRNKGAANSLLGSFAGALQTDAYAAYDDHTGVRLGCMAHARRYFEKAKKLAPRECNHVLKLIRNLYRIERELKKARGELPDDAWYGKRLGERQRRSVKLLDKLERYLLQIKDKWLLEQHPVYKAINYMLSRFDQFRVYTEDGRFEIDNNQIEQSIRPVAIGRRNWMFAGSHYGAKMAAVMMTVIRCCKRQGINPQEYLADVLPTLADQSTTSLDRLTPFDWKPTQ